MRVVTILCGVNEYVRNDIGVMIVKGELIYFTNEGNLKRYKSEYEKRPS